MSRNINFAICKYNEDANQNYLFKAPKSLQLEPGSKLLVNVDGDVHDVIVVDSLTVKSNSEDYFFMLHTINAIVSSGRVIA